MYISKHLPKHLDSIVRFTFISILLSSISVAIYAEALEPYIPEYKSINIVLKYDEEDGINPVMLLSPYSVQYEGYDEFKLDVDIKTYQHLAYQFTYVKDGHVGYILVVKKVDDLKDGDSVEFDSSTAVNKLSFKPLDKNGEEVTHAVYSKDESGNIVDIIEPGTFQRMDGHIFIFSPKQGFLDSSLMFEEWVYYDSDGTLMEHYRPDIYINNLDNEVGVGCYSHYQTLDNVNVIIKFPVWNNASCPAEVHGIGANEEVISNNPSSFVTHSHEFALTPLELSSKGIVHTGVSTGMDVNGWRDISFDYERTVTPDTYGRVSFNYTTCIDEASYEGLDVFNLYMEDYYYQDIMYWNYGFPWLTKNGKKIFYPVNQFSGTIPYGTGEFGTWDYHYPSIWPDLKNNLNKQLAFDEEKVKCLAGNYCPLSILGIYMRPEDSINDLYFFYGASGRLGETRSFDLKHIQYTKKMENNMCHLSFINDNILIDGEISGRNEIHAFLKPHGEDRYSPSMSYLWFTDSEDNITDRFASSEDGRMHFYAADFYSNFDGKYSDAYPGQNIWFFENNVLTTDNVQVEWAPYRTDDYSDLYGLREDAEKYFMPGFGNYFYADLEQIDKFSSNGWFDLRFTLTDNSGNYSVQTVSPAFHIESLSSGINSIESEENPISIIIVGSSLMVTGNTDTISGAIYTLDGNMATKIVGQETSLSMLSPGIYIVNVISGTDSATKKIVIR